MPNNSNARREKDKKKQDKKKRTDPTPLHKEDKSSADSSSLSLFLSAGNQGETGRATDAKNKDASLPLFHLGTVKATAPLSGKAEPKSDAAVEWENCQSLSKAERATVYAEAKKANPGVVGEEFDLAYRNALLKAGIEKGDSNQSWQLRSSGSLSFLWNRCQR
jgi:hypothetical protein